MSITVNPWHKFQSLLPDGQRTYGIVAGVNSSAATSLITLQNGEQITVKGSDHSTGDRVLIASGEIRQRVQTLPFNAIELY